MTTEPFEIEIPDELPESSGGGIYEVVECGYANPPAKKAMAITASGGTVRPEFHYVLQPLSFRYESDRSLFENDLEEEWAPVYNTNGDLNSKSSKFGRIKEAIEALGYRIRTNADCAALVGKKFRITRTELQFNIEGRKNPWVTLLTEPADDYEPPSSVPVRYRPPRQQQAQSLASLGGGSTGPSQEAMSALADVLDGTAESDYFSAIIGAKATHGEAVAKTVVTEPFLTESRDASTLTERMVSSGLMAMVDGKLVKNG